MNPDAKNLKDLPTAITKGIFPVNVRWRLAGCSKVQLGNITAVHYQPADVKRFFPESHRAGVISGKIANLPFAGSLEPGVVYMNVR